MALTGFSWHSKFKDSNGAATHTDQTANRKLCSINIYSMVGLVCILFFIGCTFIATDHTEKIPRWGSISSIQTTASNKCQKQCMPPGSEALPRGIVTRTSDLEMQPLYGLPERKQNPRWGSISSIQTTASNKCQKQCMPPGSEALPRGIVTRTSDLEMQPLYGTPKRKTNSSTLKSLLAIAVGIKQKESVDQIVTKFISNEFNVMLFHYDGVVDEWRDLPWCNGALHVSAINQTKWWFAKRFLHPDIVAEYSYIFLWDEDLGVENFDPRRYLSIIQEEGLEISQPALDIKKGPNVHHRITARQRRNKVHRRYYQFTGGLRCYENSTGPPCTGWVEMMAPVFSRAAWRCAWYMIQNDLVHSWGLDFKLGYCAQGERTKKVGIVDAEYIVHKAIPSLGGFDLYKVSSGLSSGKNGRLKVSSGLSSGKNGRVKVRIRSYAELDIFEQRWKNAVKEDECWTDLYPEIN